MSFTIVGKSLPRVDGLEKVTGTAVYTGDMKLPGMLVGKVLRSPYAHAKIVKIDTSKAKSLPGVKSVLTYADTPKILWNSAGFPPSQGAILVEDQYILTDKPRFAGDAVAAVAAVDEDTAMTALELIEVEYEVLPAVFDAREAMKAGAPLLHSAGQNLAGFIPIDIGDIEQGFRDADYIFEDRYVTHKVNQASLEPCGVSIASFDVNGRLTLWTSTQMPHLVRAIVAKSLGMAVGKVRLIKPHVGGGFGSRLGAVNEPISALLARKSGRPVKLQYTREEAFQATESRHPITFELKTGVKKDGTFTARQMKAYINAGAYATHTPSFAGPVAGWFLAMYKCPNIKYEGYSVYTNTAPTGAFRGYGNPQVVFAVESQLDEIARTIGMDPRELTLKNHPCKGEVWVWSNWEIENCGLEEAVSKGADSIGWEEKRGKAQGSSPNKKRGVGMGYMMHVSGARPMLHETASAIIKFNQDGSANLIYSSSDCGQGSSTVLSQIAAEELGIPFENVIITKEADTDVAPFDIGSHASRQIYSGGNAVRLAARQAKAKLLEQAAQMLEVGVDQLEVRDGTVLVKENPGKNLPVAEVVYQALYGKHGHEIMGMSSTEPPGNPPVYAAQFAEVEVDTQTGEVTVIKLVAAHDTGTAINPASVEGQIQGALQQGMGYALTEEVMLDQATGRILNPDFTDYKLLTTMDMPEIEAIIVQAASTSGPFGAKSIGESGLVPTAAAIANAIYDAVGVRVKELPITTEKVLALLREKEGT